MSVHRADDAIGAAPSGPLAPRDAADVADAIRDSAASRTRLRLAAGGTWLDAGRAVDADATLSLAALSGIVDYTPGDLTLTASAATPLGVIARLTAAERQTLALDPLGGDAGTLGATVATASAGPLAHAYGAARDNVLGLTFVDGTGTCVRAGGRVVKNVAGFDLVRLMTGAWGTLGAITEVSVRLRPLADVDSTVAVALPAPSALPQFIERARALPLAAIALELVNAPLAERLGLVRRVFLLARLAGNEAAVRAGRDALAALGDVADVSEAVWSALRTIEPPVASVLRLSTRPSQLAALVAPLVSPAAAAFGMLAHATIARGVARVIIPGATGFGMPRFDTAPRPTIVVERLPAAVWAEHGGHLAPRHAPDRLTAGVRRAFDPSSILNPGLLS